MNRKRVFLRKKKTVHKSEVSYIQPTFNLYTVNKSTIYSLQTDR